MGGVTDTDKGYKGTMEGIGSLKNMGVKIGVPQATGSEDIDGVTLAEYASYNEYGTHNKDGSVRIPPRPFIRGWVDGKPDEINNIIELLYKQVVDGKITEEQALNKLGLFGQNGIQRYIRTGVFAPLSQQTIDAKGSTTPLIDTGRLRQSIGYEITEI